MTAGDTIARECEVQSPTLDKIFTDMLEEMHRRMGNEKYIWETAEDFSTNPEWLPVDDTQIGIEFAFEYLRPFLGSALTASGHRIVGPADMKAEVKAVEIVRQWADWIIGVSADMDEPEWPTSGAQGVRNKRDVVLAALTAASPHMPVPAGWQKHYDVPEHLALDLRQIADNTDCNAGFATMNAQIMRRAAACFDGHPEETSSSKARAMLASRPNGGA